MAETNGYGATRESHDELKGLCEEQHLSDDDGDHSDHVHEHLQCGHSRVKSCALSHNPDETNPNLESARRKLTFAAVLCFFFMIGEFFGGYLANSLSIMTDAAHLLSDVASFCVSLFALHLAGKGPTHRLSFGWHRAEILGALVSVLLIWSITAILVYEAIQRVMNPPDVDGRLMFFVATGGLCVNIVMGMILAWSGHGHSHGELPGAEPSDHGHSHGGHGHGDGENINVRAALIHAIGDAIQSIGVMIAGALIWYNPDWRLADPICTFFFSILVLFTTTRLVKQSVGVLMESVPDNISASQVLTVLCKVEGVLSVHDLHIWSLSVGKPALSAHLVIADTCDYRTVLQHALNVLAAKPFRITHPTLQIEPKGKGGVPVCDLVATETAMDSDEDSLSHHGHGHGGHGHSHGGHTGVVEVAPTLSINGDNHGHSHSHGNSGGGDHGHAHSGGGDHGHAH